MKGAPKRKLIFVLCLGLFRLREYNLRSSQEGKEIFNKTLIKEQEDL